MSQPFRNFDISAALPFIFLLSIYQLPTPASGFAIAPLLSSV